MVGWWWTRWFVWRGIRVAIAPVGVALGVRSRMRVIIWGLASVTNETTGYLCMCAYLEVSVARVYCLWVGTETLSDHTRPTTMDGDTVPAGDTADIFADHDDPLWSKSPRGVGASARVQRGELQGLRAGTSSYKPGLTKARSGGGCREEL